MKAFGRLLLKGYCRTGLRGRHRLIRGIGGFLAPPGGIETVRVGPVTSI